MGNHPSQSAKAKELLTYYTGNGNLLELFRLLLGAPKLDVVNKRILVVHGAPGYGKSSLLLKFKEVAQDMQIPVALASIEDDKSPEAMLKRWADELASCGVKLSNFGNTYRDYIKQVEKEVYPGRPAEHGNAAKALITGAGIALTNLAGGAPVASLIGAAVGEASGAFIEKRHGTFDRKGSDLGWDPLGELTEDFLADVASTASIHRRVLMMDTYEQMTALDEWTRDFAQVLHQNVLLVIAGHTVPQWRHSWPGWIMNAKVEKLGAMSDEDTRGLIVKYYDMMTGDKPESTQVEALVRFVDGWPMAVTAVVDKWIEEGVGDFHSVKPIAVIADLVEYLQKDMNDQLKLALRAAGAVRWFDPDVLKAALEKQDVGVVEIYDELAHLPYVSPHGGGELELELHAAFRNVLDEQAQKDREKNKELHQRVADYLEKELSNASGDNQVRYSLESLYHHIRADEAAGIQRFQAMAEESVLYRLIDRLRALVIDLDTYEEYFKQNESRLWLRYYRVRLDELDELEGDSFPELIKKYEEIAKKAEDISPKLRAYALSDAQEASGRISQYRDQASLDTLKSIIALKELDVKLVSSRVWLSDAYRSRGQLDEAFANLEEVRLFFEKSKDPYGLAFMYNRLKYFYLDKGMWKEGLEMRMKGLNALESLAEHSYIEAELRGGPAIAWAWMGLYKEGEHEIDIALELAEHAGDKHQRGAFLRDHGLILGLQGKLKQAEECFDPGINISKEDGDPQGIALAHAFYGSVLMKWGRISDAKAQLSDAVNAFAGGLDGENWNFPLFKNLLGVLYECQGNRTEAKKQYTACLAAKKLQRWYFHAGALTGLARIGYKQADYKGIVSLVEEAEQLSQRYEYNDYLCSLRLTQACASWEGHVPAWGSGPAAALSYYKESLIYALRYNRFLLDEALSGKPQGTPLKAMAVIPYCHEKDADGRAMLLALQEWWRNGNNNVGEPRSDSISPISEGITLTVAEDFARKREPGGDASSRQKTVLKQLEAALK